MGNRMKLWMCVFGLVLAAGCSADDDGDTAPTLPEGCDYLVGPSDDAQDELQTQLIEAEENSTVCIDEGTYSFTTEISSSVNGLTIRGMGSDKTILDFSTQDVGGNGLHVTGDNVTLEDFEVRNAPGDGIRSEDVTGIIYRRLRVVWTTPASRDNGAYGLYPVKSRNVTVEDCYVTGASDAGIYVGQSSFILVRGNEVTGNVAGIEIENSVDAEVVDNLVYGNTGGVLIFNLPELPMIDGKRAKVHNNEIRDNNLPNFAGPGAFVYNVPGGSGVIILASDSNEISDNIISGNDSGGIIMTSYLDDVFGGYEDENFDRNTEGNYLFGNTYENNGKKPQGIILELGLSRKGKCGGEGDRVCFLDSDCENDLACEGAEAAPDIIFDGCIGDAPDETTNNCIQEAEGTRFSTPPAFGFCIDARNRGEGNLETSDITMFDCMVETLPAQDSSNWSM
jgi:parallel beta-helix repeat protein